MWLTEAKQIKFDIDESENNKSMADLSWQSYDHPFKEYVSHILPKQHLQRYLVLACIRSPNWS